MERCKLFDISYALSSEIAIYPENPHFCLKPFKELVKGDSSNVSLISMGSHTGTHIDAPSHVIPNGMTLDKIPLERINGKARVIDSTGVNEISYDNLKDIHIDNDDIIIFKTDNSYNWACDKVLDEYVTLTYEAAEFLAKKKIKMVGIDYLTIERPRGKRVSGKSIHKILLEEDIIICEALNLRQITPEEYNFICIPLRIIEADGCPVRCLLLEV